MASHGFVHPDATQEHPQDALFENVFNYALMGMEERGYDIAVKWDDHDIYPDNHVENVLKQYQGRSVFGRVLVKNCVDDKLMSQSISLCAGAVPTNIRVKAGESGRVSDSIPHSAISTKVVKVRCPDWSWKDQGRISGKCGCSK